MQIVKSYARIHSIDGKDSSKESGIEALRRVEWCGRISHRSEDKQTENSYERFIKAIVLGHGDWSITEHATVTVDALVDRGITHEWVRHRIGAYTQESTRFVNYGKKGQISVVCPLREWATKAISDVIIGDSSNDEVWSATLEHCELTYLYLLNQGVSPQIARSVLPNALASRLIVTYNLRMWRHFFIMRTAREAHPQMRDVTIPLLEEFKIKIPLLYDDIAAEERQIDAMRRPR